MPCLKQKQLLRPLEMPCLERCLLIRSALTQHPFAQVFDAPLDTLPVVSVLESQPQQAEAYVSVAEECCDCYHLHTYAKCKNGFNWKVPAKK